MEYRNYKNSIQKFIADQRIDQYLASVGGTSFETRDYFADNGITDNIFELSTFFRSAETDREYYWDPFYEKALLPKPIIITDLKTFKSKLVNENLNRSMFFDKILNEKNDVYMVSYVNPKISIIDKVLLKSILSISNIVSSEYLVHNIHSYFISLFYRLFEGICYTHKKRSTNNLLFRSILANKQGILNNEIPKYYDNKGIPGFFHKKIQEDIITMKCSSYQGTNYQTFLRSSFPFTFRFRSCLNIHKAFFKINYQEYEQTLYFLKYKKDLFIDVFLLSYVLKNYYVGKLSVYRHTKFEAFIENILDYTYELEKNKQFYNDFLCSIIGNGIVI